MNRYFLIGIFIALGFFASVLFAAFDYSSDLPILFFGVAAFVYVGVLYYLKNKTKKPNG